MKVLFNIMFVGVFGLSAIAYAKSKTVNLCHSSLAENQNLTVTEKLIAYFEVLVQQHYLAQPNAYMQKLLQDIHGNKPLTGLPVTRSEDKIHQESFAFYLNHLELDRVKLKIWL